MSILIEKEIDYDYGFNVDETIEMVVEECLDYQDCPYEAQVCVTLTDDETIREINRGQREIDRVTDVLSFPMLDYVTPGDFDFLEEAEVCSYFEPDSGELMLGDIVIAVPRAAAQAEEYGHSLRREIAFLAAHSMFHLFGFDHMEESERLVMEKKQREVLERLNINR